MKNQMRIASSNSFPYFTFSWNNKQALFWNENKTMDDQNIQMTIFTFFVPFIVPYHCLDSLGLFMHCNVNIFFLNVRPTEI